VLEAVEVLLKQVFQECLVDQVMEVMEQHQVLQVRLLQEQVVVEDQVITVPLLGQVVLVDLAVVELVELQILEGTQQELLVRQIRVVELEVKV
jgi:hypothetical protein